MIRFVVFMFVATALGLASSVRLGLVGLLVTTFGYMIVLIAFRAEDDIGLLGVALAMVVLQMAYVFGGWLDLPRWRRIHAAGDDGPTGEGDR